MPYPESWGVKTNFHNPKVGEDGLKKSVWAKRGFWALVLVGLLAVVTPQVVQPVLHLTDGDKPKIGTGG